MRPETAPGSRSEPQYARHGVIALVSALMLVGCSGPDGRYLTNAVDVERAARMWNDPWAAPDTTTAADGYPNGLPRLHRVVAERAYRTPVAPENAVLDEVRAAQAVGWELTGATCDTEGSFPIVASLRRDGSLDEAAIASVVVSRGEQPYGVPPATPASPEASRQSTPGPDSASLTVTITVQMPHHLDREWPNPPAVAVEDTCLAGAAPGVKAQPYPGDMPLLAGSRMPGKATKPTREEQDVPGSLIDAFDVANADPVLAWLGLNLSDPDPFAYSSPQGVSLPQVTVATTLADTVGQATAEGWSLTYTGCWASGMTVAELHPDLTGGYTVALRLQQTPDSADDPTRVAFTAAAVIASPSRGGPGPGDLEPVTAPCWAQVPVDPAGPPAFTWEGIPWFGPTTLGAVQP